MFRVDVARERAPQAGREQARPAIALALIDELADEPQGPGRPACGHQLMVADSSRKLLLRGIEMR